MRSLLDVNVLIALLDADHISHTAATAWLSEHGRRGWASCPITQNGCVRIMSHPGYPNAHSVAESRGPSPCSHRTPLTRVLAGPREPAR